MVSRDSKIHNFASSLFFVDYYKVRPSGRDNVIRLDNTPQVARTLLSIEADFNNDMVLIVLILPLISKSSKPFGVRSKCYTYNWYHCYSQVPKLFQFSGKVQVFVYLFAFIFTLWSAGTAKSIIPFLFFFLIITKSGFAGISLSGLLAGIKWSGLLAGIRWSVCMSKFQRI